MVSSLPPPPQSNLDRWSELSGFGVTDIIYTQRTSLFNRLDNLANRLQIIENLLNTRRAEVARQLSEYEEAIARLQDQLLSRQIQIEQLEREKYFLNEYFDTTEREVESWEDRLLRPTEP
jgi:flagellar capping protein FliD